MSGHAAARTDQAALARLQDLIARLETQSDSPAGSAARELLQLILDLHGQGLARFLELIRESAAADPLLERLTHDEQTRSLLLLHDLHPLALEARVAAAMEGLRPYLAVYGIAIADFSHQGGQLAMQLRCKTSPDVAPPPADALQEEIEAAVYGLAPDIESLEIKGLPVPTAYVPLASLATKAAAGKVSYSSN